LVVRGDDFVAGVFVQGQREVLMTSAEARLEAARAMRSSSAVGSGTDVELGPQQPRGLRYVFASTAMKT
jgi:hypothetical protein